MSSVSSETSSKNCWLQIASSAVVGAAVGIAGCTLAANYKNSELPEPESVPATKKYKTGDWFQEKSTFWPGQQFGLKIDEILHEETSKYQEILVFRSSTYGTVLVLDGCIQCTERDEFAYQEMMAHIPLFSHPNPKKILIVGGGDGGIAREVLRHPTVETVDMCEIDEAVCRTAKKFLPQMANSLDTPKLNLIIEDASVFADSVPENSYDVIIIDSSDPIGPAEALMEENFYKSIHRILANGGVCVCQGECMWIHSEVIRNISAMCSKIFDEVDYSWMSIPTYPCGSIGIITLSKGAGPLVSSPIQSRVDENTAILGDLKYYTPQIHVASFVKPKFVQEFLKNVK